MNRSILKSATVAALLVTGLLTTDVATADVTTAEPKYDLTAGLSPADVIKRWGKPTEKTERETQRQILWRYPNGARVLFVEGEVAEWRLTDEEVARREALNAPLPETSEVSDEITENDTRDLVREIANEVPSDPDSPGGEVDPAIAGTSLMPNQNALGIAPGVQVVQDPEEEE